MANRAGYCWELAVGVGDGLKEPLGDGLGPVDGVGVVLGITGGVGEGSLPGRVPSER